MPVPEETVASLGAKFEALLPHLDERARRLTLAAEARSLGHGGIAAVARASGASASRIAKGVAELESGEAPISRIRHPGAGRPAAAVKDPGLVPALLALVEPTRRGDPTSALCWTTLSTTRLAAELTAAGHRVSPDTVGKLLKEAGFSLQANSKQIEGSQHPDRDGQFSYLNDQAGEHLAAGCPVISVDTKKKELVGNYKNKGSEWRPKGAPERVKVHDFIGPKGEGTGGKANPYGVYDVGADAGWVTVGTDHDTAAFAVNTIRTWWNSTGRHTYPDAARLLITADGGGSNGYRTRAFKTELANLAAESGLTITVCHLPPGTSKWNKIEHRLLSHISMNWRGRPLTSHDVIVNTIAATTTSTGLSVHAELDQNEYPTGIKIPDQQMRDLEDSGTLTRHDWHGEWNYSLNRTTRTPKYRRALSVPTAANHRAESTRGEVGQAPGQWDLRPMGTLRMDRPGWKIVVVAAPGFPDRRPPVVLIAALGASMLLLALAPLALPPSYSWVELGTSEAAAQGIEGAWVARMGFVLLGLAVLGICVLCHGAWQPLATGLHACFGVGMVLVAVYSHAPWEAGIPYVELEDRLHSVFASVVGFSFIAGVAVTLAGRRPRTRPRTAGDITVILVAVTVPLLMASPIWGVLQRLMFLTAAGWYASELLLHTAPRPVQQERHPPHRG